MRPEKRKNYIIPNMSMNIEIIPKKPGKDYTIPCKCQKAKN